LLSVNHPFNSHNHALELWRGERTYQEQGTCEASFRLSDQVSCAKAVRAETYVGVELFIQVHTIGLSVDVCRLATDARVAGDGDFVNVLVNACHV